MLIAFASDYGHEDEFVGVCKAVMLGISPGLTIVDLGHDIPAHDVRAEAEHDRLAHPDEFVLVAVVGRERDQHDVRLGVGGRRRRREHAGDTCCARGRRPRASTGLRVARSQVRVDVDVPYPE